MPPPSPSQWAWSDAWFLAAVPVTGTAALTDVVAAADWINHAILSEDEVTTAVRRLLGAGLLAVDRRQFGLTAAGRELATGLRGQLLAQVDDLLRRLGQLPVAESDWSLAPGELRDAVHQWYERA